MTKLTQNVLEKIKQEDIKPKPKWYFIAMHFLLWLSVIFSIVLGALALAITLRQLTSAPWDLLRVAIPGRVRAFGIMLPYLWLCFIGLTVLLASRLFAHTKKGYKIRPVYVVLASIFLSFVLGTGFYFVKLDQPIHDQLQNHLPPYAQWQKKRDQMILAPEKGVLVGVIRRINQDKELILIDFKRERWLVSIHEVQVPELFVGMPVGILGQKTGRHQFDANAIQPIDPRRFGAFPLPPK